MKWRTKVAEFVVKLETVIDSPVAFSLLLSVLNNCLLSRASNVVERSEAILREQTVSVNDPIPYDKSDNGMNEPERK